MADPRPWHGLMLAAGLAMTIASGLLLSAAPARAATSAVIDLGNAGRFAILAGSPSVTSTGPTAVVGDVGIDPSPTVAGLATDTVDGTIHRADLVAQAAKRDLALAFNDGAARAPATPVARGVLRAGVLAPGVYTSDISVLALAGSLILDGRGDPAVTWILQAPAGLTVAASSIVRLINGAQACNVFWLVDGAAAIGAGTAFVGTIIATTITMADGVALQGRALALDGSVTLANDRVALPACAGGSGASQAAVAVPVLAATLAATPMRATPPAADTGMGLPVLLAAVLVVLVVTSLLGEVGRPRRYAPARRRRFG